MIIYVDKSQSININISRVYSYIFIHFIDLYMHCAPDLVFFWYLPTMQKQYHLSDQVPQLHMER